MKDYYVQLPLAGILAFSIQAESEEDAIEKALSTDWNVSVIADGSIELEELDTYEKTVKGNVNYTPLWYATAEEE